MIFKICVIIANLLYCFKFNFYLCSEIAIMLENSGTNELEEDFDELHSYQELLSDIENDVVFDLTYINSDY